MSATQEYKPKKTKAEYFRKKIDDWEQVRNDFINGHLDEGGKRQFPSYQELAEKYGVAVGSIYNKSSQEKWSKIRTLTQTKIKEKREAAELRAIVSESATYEAMALEMIYKLLKLGHLKVHKYREFYDRDFNFEDLDTDALPEIDVKELQTLASTTKELVNLARRIIGDDQSSSLQEELRNMRSKVKTELGSEEKIIQLQKQLSQIQRVRQKVKDSQVRSVARYA